MTRDDIEQAISTVQEVMSDCQEIVNHEGILALPRLCLARDELTKLIEYTESMLRSHYVFYADELMESDNDKGN